MVKIIFIGIILVKQTENLNQDVLIKGYIHSNNYSNNDNNNNKDII